MTSLDWALLIAAAIAGVMIMGLFAGLEMGLYTLNRVRLQLRVGQADHRALILSRLLGRPERMLAVVLIGTNAANQLGAWSIARMLHAGGVGAFSSILIDTIILVPLLLVVAEILPKDLFRSHGDRWCYKLAPLLRGVEFVLTWIGLVPLCTVFGRFITRLTGGQTNADLSARQRMTHLLLEGRDAGVLSEGQSELLSRALSLGERLVGGEMVPWRSVRTLPMDADDRSRNEAVASPWTRFPVIDHDGGIAGIVSVVDLYCTPDIPIDELAVHPLRLHPDDAVSDALRQLRSHQSQIAIIETTTGRPLGIVTLKDLVEPLTGELEGM
jgi:putative hemolysin